MKILETAESIRSSPEKKAEVIPAGLQKHLLPSLPTAAVVEAKIS